MILLISISQIPIITIALVTFILFVAFRIRTLRAKEVKRDEAFWERERMANLTPARDLSAIDYITIPIEKFPLSFFVENPDEEADMIIDELTELSKTRLLNLNGKTNTDLKLEYGRKNLPEMQQIDERFSRVTVLLCDLAKCFMEKEKYAEAAQILEYGMSIGSDISSNYTLLGECYKKLGDEDKFSDLRQKVDSMDFLMKGAVLRSLDAMNTDH
ncbi:MAG: hypothetical protein PUG04_05300 [Lachnospiraceae bacterium]|nr:hypothetical protein [Lachnospiraceae bacterium]